MRCPDTFPPHSSLKAFSLAWRARPTKTGRKETTCTPTSHHANAPRPGLPRPHPPGPCLPPRGAFQPFPSAAAPPTEPKKKAKQPKQARITFFHSFHPPQPTHPHTHTPHPRHTQQLMKQQRAPSGGSAGPSPPSAPGRTIESYFTARKGKEEEASPTHPLNPPTHPPTYPTDMATAPTLLEVPPLAAPASLGGQTSKDSPASSLSSAASEKEEKGGGGGDRGGDAAPASRLGGGGGGGEGRGVFAVGDVVDVAEDMRPGVYRCAGVARVTKVGGWVGGWVGRSRGEKRLILLPSFLL